STPIVAFYFDRVPLISVPANLVVVPLVSLAVLGILALLSCHAVLPVLGALAGSLVDRLLSLVVHLLTWLGGESMPVLSTAGWFGGPGAPLLLVLALGMTCLLVLAVRYQEARRLLVVTSMIAVNVVLAVIVLSPGDPGCVEVSAHRVPGGVLTVVDWGGDAGCDVVVSGLARKTYRLDERVMLPLLERHGLDRVRRVIVQVAAYDALDDLLRLVAATGRPVLYVPERLRPSIRDVIAQDSTAVAPHTLVFYGDTSLLSSNRGYTLTESHISLRLPDTEVCLAYELDNMDTLCVEGTGGGVLIIGQAWSPAPADWIEWHARGWDIIVCSTIAHRFSDQNADPSLEPDGFFPDYLHILARDGVFRQSLTVSPDR
ncbi:MAG: ComEC/Rec2 family competence protein, partial [candidate division Zixibacteria bacterium]|nr:ComEC/Rec2 family competence protein [candidate division Zixibacteria bacterium]